jgi:integrase
MPYKLVPPNASRRSPYWRVRGTEHGIYRDSSTETRDKRKAQQFLLAWRAEAERSALSGEPERDRLTFAAAAISYMQAGHDKRFLAPLIRALGEMAIEDIAQADVDRVATTAYPDATAATRNRQVYTPLSAVMKHAGVDKRIRRPKGWRSRPRPEGEVFALLEAASGLHARFAALLTFLLYTGARLSDATTLEWPNVDLVGAGAILEDTKNGETIPVHLPVEVLAALANLEGERKGRVFRLTKSGRLYLMLQVVCRRAGVNLPQRSAFHILRHTHAHWRRLHTGADTSALVATGLWKSHEAARVYEHLDASEEQRKSDLFPTPKRKK